MKEIMLFKNDTIGVSVGIICNGEDVWFIAKDVAKFLEYTRTADMTKRLDDDEKSTLIEYAKMAYGLESEEYAYFSTNNMTIINESGFYNAIIGSKKPEAKIFKKWITSEVLPSLRKTGSYSLTEKVPTTYIEALEALLIAEKEKLRLATENKSQKDLLEEAKPKIDFYDKIIQCKDVMYMSDVAKIISKPDFVIGSIKLFEFLRIMKVLQSSETYHNIPYQHHIDKGRFVLSLKEYEKPIEKGSSMKEQALSKTTMVTTKGLEYITKLISKHAEWKEDKKKFVLIMPIEQDETEE